MIIVRILLPFLYCILITVSYCVVTKKHFIDSIAPVFFIQIIVMLITGMCFHSISCGILLCIVVSVGILGINVYKTHSLVSIIDVFRDYRLEVLFWSVIYLFVFISNYGKHFNMWDEFSHWGLFIKESFRLDALYCMSPVSMAHKDYVPAITLFETLWCKLSLRYSEADSYRGIQILQLSMLSPIVFKTANKIAPKIKTVIGKSIIVFGIPMLFHTLDFYHTVYQDLIFGVLVYYCIYLIFVGISEESRINDFEIILATTVLILSKMTAMAFLPMVALFFFFYRTLICKKNVKQSGMAFLLISAIPIIVWLAFNKYVDIYVPNSGSGQSYDSLSLNGIIKVIGRRGLNDWQYETEAVYIRALFEKAIIGKASYVTIVVVVTVLLLVYSFLVKKEHRRAVLISDLWILISAAAYAMLMWYLYLTAFTEYEASYLASYDRYMSSYVLCACLLLASVLIYFETNEFCVVSIIGASIIVQDTIFFMGFNQLIPGVIVGEEVRYIGEQEYICNSVPENGSLLIITRSEQENILNGEAATMLNYYCSPRIVKSTSPGEKINEDDIYSYDYSSEEFISLMSNFDYIYMLAFDDEFIEEYGDCFTNPEMLILGKIYSIEIVNDKIQLQ